MVTNRNLNVINPWKYRVYNINKSGWQDLNLRPHAPHACALPGCATSRIKFKYSCLGRDDKSCCPNVIYLGRGGRITPLGRETASLNSNLRPSRFYRDAMTSHIHPNVIYLSRGGRIRTCDLLLPKQARWPGYATPRKVSANITFNRLTTNPKLSFL